MGCCGDKRTLKAGVETAGSGPSAPQPAGTQTADLATVAPAGRGDQRTARVRYLRRSTVRMYGPASHRLYEFSARRDEQAVYKADLPHLLRTGLFESV
jgi:hypothetical protein